MTGESLDVRVLGPYAPVNLPDVKRVFRGVGVRPLGVRVERLTVCSKILVSCHSRVVGIVAYENHEDELRVHELAIAAETGCDPKRIVDAALDVLELACLAGGAHRIVVTSRSDACQLPQWQHGFVRIDEECAGTWPDKAFRHWTPAACERQLDGRGTWQVLRPEGAAAPSDTDSTPRQRPEQDEVEKPDIREKGGLKEGHPQRSDDRLFMQLLAWGDCTDARPVADALARAGIDGVVYEELNDARGVAILTLTNDLGFFLNRLRPMVARPPFASLRPKPEFTMLGRTYSLGYEPDLDATLFHRPRRTVLNPEWPWAIWYPLRRKGAFAQLPEQKQRKILAEDAAIGMAFGTAGHPHDVRLACHGLDKDDNDFVIGLIGKDLYPLSVIVQTMRKTRQTSLYLKRPGPFFIGKAIWQAPG